MLTLFKKLNHTHTFSVILILYTFSFGFNMLNTGVFWDDWTLYNQSPASIKHSLYSSGYFSFGFLLQSISPLTIPQMVAFRVFVFFAYLSIAFIAYIILTSISTFNESKLLMLLLILILPLNHARISLVILTHILNLLFFAFGFLLILYYLKSKKPILRILSLLLFGFSFFTNSLVFFYAVPLSYLVFKSNSQLTLSSCCKTILKHIDYFLLPLVFLILKFTLLKPTGIYENYNTLKLHNVFRSPYLLLADVYNIGKEIISLIMHTNRATAIAVVACGVAIFPLMRGIVKNTPQPSHKPWVILSGFVILILGMWPYTMLMKTPLFFDWYSRQQILMSFGGAIFIAGIYFYATSFFSPRALLPIMLLSLFTSMCVTYNFTESIQYLRDNLKQQSIMMQMQTNVDVKENHSFFVTDNCHMYDAKHRIIRNYEYTGMLRKIFGTQDKYASSELQFTPEDSLLNKFEEYNFMNYLYTPYQYKISIRQGETSLTTFNTIKLSLMHLTGDKADEEIKKIIRVEVTALNN